MRKLTPYVRAGNAAWSLVGLAVLVCLFLLGGYSRYYLLFHTLAESFSIVVGFGIFAIAWNARRQIDSSFLSTFGMALLGVSAIDLLHMLAYKGMHVFPEHVGTANLATQLWLAARMLQTAGLLTAAALAAQRPRPVVALAGSVLLFALLTAAVFGGVFPQAYDDAAGRLTPFKIVSEYVLVALMALSMVLLIRGGQLDRRVGWLVGSSIVAMMLAELSFTLYHDVQGMANRLGHLLMIVAFYLIYKALIQTGLRSPYRILFRNLKLSQGRLQQAQQELEERVQQRTADLRRTVEQLEREVRDRIDAQEALRRSEQKFRNLVEHIPAVTYVSGLEGLTNILYFSPQIEHLLGYGPTDFENDPGLFARLLHPDDRQRLLGRNPAEPRGESAPCEYRVLDRSGNELWLRDESRVICDEAGQPLFIQGFMVDITTRKRQERQLGEAHQEAEAQRLRFFSVLNMLPGYVALRAADGTIRFANQRYTECFGPFEGRKCYQVQHQREDPCPDCPMDRIQRTGQPGEWEWTSPDKRTFHVWGYPMADGDDDQAVLELGVDVTHQKDLERQVIDAGEAERRRIGRNLHDTLGQNLTGLAFLIKSLSRKFSQKEALTANQIVELVNESVAQVRGIARGLDPVGLEREGLTSSLQELAGRTASVFGIPCGFDCPCAIDVSQEVASHLYYIAQEALTNAVKHAQPTQIVLQLQAEDSLVKLSIIDDGKGLGGDHRGQKGMGMYIMQYRARALGGSLSIRSGPDGGTVVSCVAPAK